jgi:large conductance mechanosensitive channel
MLREFKEFIIRGNALDMAVGLIMGAAFGAIVSSLVDDVIMPPIGLILGGVDFSDIFINLSYLSGLTDAPVPSYAAAKETGVAAIGVGVFLNAVIKFVIVALAIFMLVKAVNRLMRKEKPKEEAPAAPPIEVQLLTEIRDLLKNQKTQPGSDVM